MEFRILDPKSNSAEVKSAYDLWRCTWLPILRKLDGVSKLHSDAFLNLDAIGVIFEGGNPIAFHGYKLHDIDNRVELDRETFTSYSNDAFRRLKFRGCRTAITLEWACVDPTYRKEAGKDLFKVLTALSLNYWRFTGVDCALAVTYNLRKVDDLCRFFNCDELCEDAFAHGVSVSFFAAYRIVSEKYLPQDIMIQKRADKLFSQIFEAEGRRAPEVFL